MPVLLFPHNKRVVANKVQYTLFPSLEGRWDFLCLHIVQCKRQLLPELTLLKQPQTAAVYGLTYIRMHFSGILGSIRNFIASRKATRKAKHGSTV